MIYTIIYSFILITCLFFSILRKRNKMGIFLLFIYSFVSIFSIFLNSKKVGTTDINFDDISIWPFLFLLFCYFLCFSPFLSKSQTFSSNGIISYKRNSFLKTSLYFYFFCSIFRLFLETPNVLNLIKSGDWMQTYAVGSNIVYSTPIGQIIMMFVSYFRLIAIIFAFVIFVETNGKKSMDHYISFLTIIFAFATGVFGALSSASRSLLFETIIIFVAVVIFFFNRLTKRQKIFVLSSCFLVLAGLIIIIFKISDDRFNARGTEDSLLFYLGQAPIVFNSQMFFGTQSLMLGEYAFGGLFGNNSFDPSVIGGQWGTMFYTYVGFLFIDWGPAGTLLICCLFFFIFKKITKKEKYRISDIFLLFLFYQFLLNGVFVVGRNYCVSLLVNIFIFLIIRIFDSNYSTEQNKIEQIVL